MTNGIFYVYYVKIIRIFIISIQNSCCQMFFHLNIYLNFFPSVIKNIYRNRFKTYYYMHLYVYI